MISTRNVTLGAFVVLAVWLAPWFWREVTACALYAPRLILTHHINARGTYDRNLWVRVARGISLLPWGPTSRVCS